MSDTAIAQGPDSEMLLLLADIASWPPFDEAIQSAPRIVAGVPSLQRGLVWRAGQVELLWDSLARGFPVGSLIVCARLASELQYTRGLTSRVADMRVTHHLLDGQQRAQAIRLGFHDPFGPSAANAALNGQLLWLDLAADRPGGTRAYRFRVTTKAHPWGYAPDDDASRLPVTRIREALIACGCDPDDDNPERRPEPAACWPVAATAPVPLAWLLLVKDDSDAGLIAAIHARCAAVPDTLPYDQWVSAVRAVLSAPEQSRQLRTIWQAVRRIRRTRIPVLEVPADVMAGDNDDLGDAEQAVTVAETLFQRLNTLGTTLDGDELAYSMIKAHWPDIEESIAALAHSRKLPEARLVSLAARIPVNAQGDPGHAVSTRVSVEAIRRLAVRDPGTQAHSDFARRQRDVRARFDAFFLRDEQASLGPILEQVCRWCMPGTSFGLPLVLQTSIARSAPNAYALLLWMAHKALLDGTEADASTGRHVQALISALRWFALDGRRAPAAIAVLIAKGGPITSASLAGVLRQVCDDNTWLVRLPPSPAELAETLPEPQLDDIDSWRWREGLRGSEESKDAVRRIMREDDMLLYAQRALIKEKFAHYDPSRRDMWSDHDRPWDFDHIVPSKVINYNQRLVDTAKQVVRQWGLESIANRRAWPMTQNRSDQAMAPDIKLGKEGLPKNMPPALAMEWSFLEGPELAGFQRGFDYTQDSGPEALRDFVAAARHRLLRIYASWYGPEGLDVGHLTRSV